MIILICVENAPDQATTSYDLVYSNNCLCYLLLGQQARRCLAQRTKERVEGGGNLVAATSSQLQAAGVQAPRLSFSVCLSMSGWHRNSAYLVPLPTYSFCVRFSGLVSRVLTSARSLLEHVYRAVVAANRCRSSSFECIVIFKVPCFSLGLPCHSYSYSVFSAFAIYFWSYALLIVNSISIKTGEIPINNRNR